MDIFDQIQNSNEVNFNILLHKKFQRVFYTESLCFGDILIFYDDITGDKIKSKANSDLYCSKHHHPNLYDGR